VRYYRSIYLTLIVLILSSNALVRAQTPEAALNYYNHGLEKLERGEQDGAIEDFTAYLDADKDGMDPNRAMGLRLRGFIFNTLQQDVKAQQDYDAACMINKQLDVCSN